MTLVMGPWSYFRRRNRCRHVEFGRALIRLCWGFDALGTMCALEQERGYGHRRETSICCKKDEP